MTNGTLVGIPKNQTSPMVPYGTTVSVNCFEGFKIDKPGNSTCSGIYHYKTLFRPESCIFTFGKVKPNVNICDPSHNKNR